MIVSNAVTTAAAGLLFGLSLIVAIGAQNTYVIRQGLLRRYVGPVITVCAVSDVVLIAAGVGGASAILDGRAWLLRTVQLLGVGFLFGYAALAARRALSSSGSSPTLGAAGATLGTVIGTCLALTWLNPAVYLDTLVLLGSVAQSHRGNQWWFGIGAMIGSVLWFVGLGFGARLLQPLFATRTAWRGLDVFVAGVMLLTGIRVLVA